MKISQKKQLQIFQLTQLTATIGGEEGLRRLLDPKNRPQVVELVKKFQRDEMQSRFTLGNRTYQVLNLHGDSADISAKILISRALKQGCVLDDDIPYFKGYSEELKDLFGASVYFVFPKKEDKNKESLDARVYATTICNGKVNTYKRLDHWSPRARFLREVPADEIIVHKEIHREGIPHVQPTVDLSEAFSTPIES